MNISYSNDIQVEETASRTVISLFFICLRVDLQYNDTQSSLTFLNSTANTAEDILAGAFSASYRLDQYQLFT